MIMEPLPYNHLEQGLHRWANIQKGGDGHDKVPIPKERKGCRVSVGWPVAVGHFVQRCLGSRYYTTAHRFKWASACNNGGEGQEKLGKVRASQSVGSRYILRNSCGQQRNAEVNLNHKREGGLSVGRCVCAQFRFHRNLLRRNWYEWWLPAFVCPWYCVTLCGIIFRFRRMLSGVCMLLWKIPKE